MVIKMVKLYKNYVIEKTDVIIDYPQDFCIENFNYDKYELYLTKKIEEKFNNEVYIINNSLLLNIVSENDEIIEFVKDLIESLDYSDDIFYD